MVKTIGSVVVYLLFLTILIFWLIHPGINRGDKSIPGCNGGSRNGWVESAWMHGNHDCSHWSHAQKQLNAKNWPGQCQWSRMATGVTYLLPKTCSPLLIKQGNEPSELPPWMKFLHTKLANPSTPLNIRLFISKLVINTEEVNVPWRGNLPHFKWISTQSWRKL